MKFLTKKSSDLTTREITISKDADLLIKTYCDFVNREESEVVEFLFMLLVEDAAFVEYCNGMRYNSKLLKIIDNYKQSIERDDIRDVFK